MTDTPENQEPKGEGLTAAMDNIERKYGRPNQNAPQRPFAERTRQAWRYVRPHWYRVAWWVMLAISILVIALDADAQLGGLLGRTIDWIRQTIFQTYPSVPFVLGVLACYYVFVKGRFLGDDNE